MQGGEQLVRALMERQAADGMTDADLARAIGVSRSLWSHLRAGRRSPGLIVVRGARRAYPDLVADWLIFLSDNDPIGDILSPCEDGVGRLAEAAS